MVGEWKARSCRLQVEFCPPRKTKGQKSQVEALQGITVETVFSLDFKKKVKRSSGWASKPEHHVDVVEKASVHAINIVMTTGGKFCNQKKGEERFGYKTRELVEYVLQQFLFLFYFFFF